MPITEANVMIVERKLRRGLWLISNDRIIEKVVAWWRVAPFPFTSAVDVYEMYKANA